MSRIEQALKKAAKERKDSVQSERLVPPDRGQEAATVEPVAVSEPHGVPRQDAGALLKAQPITIKNQMLVSALSERSAAVEEYNKLRSTVIALTRGETFKNTLLITSCAPEEGKSITALNLAISMAKEQDHTVLLVDADLRRPSMHRYLGIEPEYGLVHCLRDGLPLEKALVKTGIGKLVVLPAGEAVKDPLDMLSSKKMKDIVKELKERYSERYVIFDSPPALPFADAGALAAMVDATLFVVREGKANKDDVRKTLDAFRDNGLLGVVYNDSHSTARKSGYYYYY